MHTNATLTPHIVQEQLAQLQAERRYYSARLMAIAGDLDRREELNGYLILIENINIACLRLARANGPSRAAPSTVKLAA